MAALTDAHKEALKQFRERHRDVAEAAKQHAVAFRKARKAVEGALKAGAATIPQLAERAKLPADQVLWHLAGLRKYGRAREAGQDGDYVQYEYVAPEQEKPSSEH
jgi:hypothetical protein